MRLPLRAMLLALFACAACAAPASAGQIVYGAGDSIHVMNDNGSGDRPLIAPDDVPGAVSVYYPHVQPNSQTVVFSARTPYAGYNGLYCGFSCVGIYRWDAGRITRISHPPSDCAGGDLCSGFDVDPKLTADGQRVYYELNYIEPDGGGGIDGIETPHVAPAVARGVARAAELKGDCSGNSHYTPSPAGNDVAFIDCDGNTSDYWVKVQRGAAAPVNLGTDDVKPEDLAWRPDGGRLAQAEGGADPGLWSISTQGDLDPRHVVQLTWDGDHAQFETSPAWVGTGSIAFAYGDEIRLAPADCNACTLAQTRRLVAKDEIKSLAWTGQTLPVVRRGGDDEPPPPPPPPPPPAGDVTAKLQPKKLKLGKALKGLTVPFTVAGPGKLRLKAQVDGKTARKLKLSKKRKTVTVASGSASPKTAGRASIKLRFTGAAKKRLKRAKSVRLKLAGTWTPNGGNAKKLSARLTLKR